MAKGLTPIIGLAVVVALAMVAVFGAMSLANPAWAQATDTAPTLVKGAPTNVTVYTGHNTKLNLADYFKDGTGLGAIQDYQFNVTGMDDLSSFSNINIFIDNVAASDDIESGGLEVGTKILVAGVTVDTITRLTVEAVDGGTGEDDPDDAFDTDGKSSTEPADDNLTVDLVITAFASTGAEVKDKVEEDELDVATVFTEDSMTVNVFDYFTPGLGSGEITGFTYVTVPAGGAGSPLGNDGADVVAQNGTPAMENDGVTVDKKGCSDHNGWNGRLLHGSDYYRECYHRYCQR